MPKRFFTATLAAALVLPALAHGHDLSPAPDRDRMVASDQVPTRVERALGGEVTALPTGLYEVESPRGYTYTTHGPDPKTEELESPLTQGAPERPPACVSDPATDYYQRVLYGYPASGANDLAAREASIQAQIRRNNWLINESSLASGGPEADFKVLCDGGGEISVTAFPVTPDLAGTNASFTRIVNGAQNAGFTNARVDYTIFYDSNGPACGVGNFFGDESPGAGNLNNNPGFTGAGYGVTYEACWFGRTSIHENAHNQGAAQYSAPNSTGSGAHCNEFNDILCYVDGGDLNQAMIECPLGPPAVGGYHYDCSWNTYFDAAPESGEWLSDHWNIGSPVNRFIRFGSDTWDPDTTILTGPGESTTEATFTFTSSEEPATFGCSLVAAGIAAQLLAVRVAEVLHGDPRRDLRVQRPGDRQQREHRPDTGDEHVHVRCPRGRESRGRGFRRCVATADDDLRASGPGPADEARQGDGQVRFRVERARVAVAVSSRWRPVLAVYLASRPQACGPRQAPVRGPGEGCLRKRRPDSGHVLVQGQAQAQAPLSFPTH